MNMKKIIGPSAVFVIAGAGLFKLLCGKEPQKYSSKWFETVTDEVLNTEREIVKRQYCSSGDNFSLAVSLKNLLDRFDSVLSKRAWGNEVPHGPSYSRQHGYNLYKKD